MQWRYHSNCNHFSLVTVSNSPMWQVSNRKGVGLKMAQTLINGQHMIIFNYYQYGAFVTPWTNERKMQMFQLLPVPVGVSKTKYSIEITTNSFWLSSIVAVLWFINMSTWSMKYFCSRIFFPVLVENAHQKTLYKTGVSEEIAHSTVYHHLL